MKTVANYPRRRREPGKVQHAALDFGPAADFRLAAAVPMAMTPPGYGESLRSDVAERSASQARGSGGWTPGDEVKVGARHTREGPQNSYRVMGPAAPPTADESEGGDQ